MVDGPNTYGFCGGDPVNRSDPMGTDWVVIDTKDRLVQPFADEARADAIDLAFRIGGRVEYMAPDRVAKLDAARKFTGIILAREFDDRPPVEMVTLAGPMGTRQLTRGQWDAEKAEARAAQAAFQRLAEARNAAEANAQADMVDLGGGVQMLNPFSARGTQRLSDVAPEAFEMVGGINWREASAGEWALWAITLPAGGKGAQLARGGKKVYVALRKGQALRRASSSVLEVVDDAADLKTRNVYHATGNAGAAQSVVAGIDPKYLNNKARFGKAFYVAEEAGTAIAEVAAHNGGTTHGIRFGIDLSKARVLDLTDAATARKWGYSGGPISSATQAIGANARSAGYNTIKYPSLRGSGANYAVLDDFNNVLSPQMITPTSLPGTVYLP